MPLLDDAPPPPAVLPVPRYAIMLIQRGAHVTTEITLPHETNRARAIATAKDALLLHAPGTEAMVQHITDAKPVAVYAARIDEHRQIVKLA